MRKRKKPKSIVDSQSVDSFQNRDTNEKSKEQRDAMV